MLRGCGSAALAFAMRFSSAVGSLKARGTVAGSMGPMYAERGSVARASDGCIGINALLHTRNLCQHVQKRSRGRDMPTSRPSPRVSITGRSLRGAKKVTRSRRTRSHRLAPTTKTGSCGVAVRHKTHSFLARRVHPPLLPCQSYQDEAD